MIMRPEQILTKEVLDWQGLHLLHFYSSICSQKVRILLNEKNMAWTSHLVDLVKQEHVSKWFLGINPRGVVPALVHDGVVHVESNEIMHYLDGLPSAAPSFFRTGDEKELEAEDQIHKDIRNLTMGFAMPKKLVVKSEETLQRYETQGVQDEQRQKEVAWWRSFAQQGVTREAAQRSAAKLRGSLDHIEAILDDDFLGGQAPSALDAAWFINTDRLQRVGYPFKLWHPKLALWFQRLKQRPAFHKEIQTPLLTKTVSGVYKFYRNLLGTGFRHWVKP